MADTSSRPEDRPQPAAPRTDHPLNTVRDELDRLFDGFFPATFGRSLLGLDPLGGRGFGSLGEVTPSLDVRQCVDRYEIAAEMPGMKRKDVAVTVRDGVLSIAGESSGPAAAGTGKGRRFTSFLRLFRLPRDADSEAIGASFDKGVLTVTVPRHDEAPMPDHKIEVKGH